MKTQTEALREQHLTDDRLLVTDDQNKVVSKIGATNVELMSKRK